MSKQKKHYIVESPISCDGVRYKPGTEEKPVLIELTSEQAKEMLAIKAISEGDADKGKLTPADHNARITAIVEAIGTLEKGNPDHWTNDNLPDAKALTKILGWNFFKQVKAEERNQAWARFNTQ